MKVTGVPYEEISKAGGGIASSARALRETAGRRRPRPGDWARHRDAPHRHDHVRVQVGLRPLA